MDILIGVLSARITSWYVDTSQWSWSRSGRTGPSFLPFSGCGGSNSWRIPQRSWRLVPTNFHFIHQGWDNVMSLLAADKQGWLQGIQLARDSQVTASPAHRQQQQLMEDFFQIAYDWFHLLPVPELYTQSLNGVEDTVLHFVIVGDTLTWSTVVWSSGW